MADYQTLAERRYQSALRWRRRFHYARQWFWPLICAALTFMLLNPGVWPR